MRRFAIVVAVLIAGVALAQRVVTIPLPLAKDIRQIELDRTDDGGVSMTVQSLVTSVEGVVHATPATCQADDLTAAQRTALATIRAAAIACVRLKAFPDGGY